MSMEGALIAFGLVSLAALAYLGRGRRLIPRLRAWWTRLRGGRPCDVCGRRAMSIGSEWYTGREKFLHAEHLIGGVSKSTADSETEA